MTSVGLLIHVHKQRSERLLTESSAISYQNCNEHRQQRVNKGVNSRIKSASSCFIRSLPLVELVWRSQAEETQHTCPIISVLFGHLGTVAEEDPHGLQVPEGHGEVERRAAPRVHRLNVILKK